MLETLPRCEFCFGILEKNYLAGDLNLTKPTPGKEPSDLGESLPDLWHLPYQELPVPDKQNHRWTMTCPKRNLFLKVFIFFHRVCSNGFFLRELTAATFIALDFTCVFPFPATLPSSSPCQPCHALTGSASASPLIHNNTKN